MAEHDNSYKSIIKGTSIFGGVQILNILISLVRGKFVAMLLGPEGMGISALFTNSANSIQRLASLGLNLAIVKRWQLIPIPPKSCRVSFRPYVDRSP